MRLLRSAEGLFVAAALLFGSLVLVLTPPDQFPDEPDHVRRAFQISEGHIVPEVRPKSPGTLNRFLNATGSDLPIGLDAVSVAFSPINFRTDRKTSADTIRSAFGIRLHPEKRVFLGFSNTAAYPPLPYLPQVLAIQGTRLLTDSALACYYAARLASLLTSTLLVALAIRTTPIFKWGLVFLALTPMSLFLMASPSADGFTNGICYLLIAIILRCAFGDPLPARGWLSAAVTLAVCVGVTKLFYFLLPALFLIVPSQRLGGRRRHAFWLCMLLGLPVAAEGFWLALVGGTITPAQAWEDPGAHLRYLFLHPLAFLRAIPTTIRQKGLLYVEEHVGVLGTMDTVLPTTLLVAVLLALTLMTFLDCRRDVVMTRNQRFSTLFLWGASVLVILFLSYVFWMPMGSPYIGLQGRYFMPVTPLLCLAGHGLRPFRERSDLTRRFLPLFAALFLPLSLSVTTYTLWERYFGPGGLRDPTFSDDAALGEGFLRAGQVEDAKTRLAEALRSNAGDAKANFLLGTIAEAEEDREAASAHYRGVLRLHPRARGAAVRLAWLLATEEDPDPALRTEALRLARVGCPRGACDEPLALDALAAALAADGRHPEAVAVVREGIDRAEEAGAEELARAMRGRLELYESGRPLLAPAPP